MPPQQKNAQATPTRSKTSCLCVNEYVFMASPNDHYGSSAVIHGRLQESLTNYPNVRWPSRVASAISGAVQFAVPSAVGCHDGLRRAATQWHAAPVIQTQRINENIFPQTHHDAGDPTPRRPPPQARSCPGTRERVRNAECPGTARGRTVRTGVANARERTACLRYGVRILPDTRSATGRFRRRRLR